VSLGVGEGDEVIVPSFTFIASVNSILYTGAKPVFVDIDMVTWNLDPEDVKKKISPKTKAIMAVHIYGNPAPLDEILQIARREKLFVIEDAAEALGAEYKKKKIGSLGNISCFSFYGNKTITCGEGGMVCTNDDAISDKIKMLRDHGMSPQKRYYHEILAYNYRITNLQAAVGLSQFERLSDFLKERDRIFNRYSENLKNIEQIQLPFSGDDTLQPVNWLFTMLLKDGDRDELMQYLREKRIDTRPSFHPCHKMPYINHNIHLPVTEKISATGVSLPTFVDLKDEQIDYITNMISEFFK